MRVARSTVRANLRPVAFTTATPEEFERQRRRQDALNLVAGSGCGTCSGFSPFFGTETGETEMRCPLLEPERVGLLTKDQEKLAQGCGMPDLYRKVYRNEMPFAEVTEGLVFLTCPFIEVEDEQKQDGDGK